MPVVQKRENPTRVAVIGAGVSGLCAAKYLMAERHGAFPNQEYFEVVVFDQNAQAGGVWNQTPADDPYATPIYPSCNTNVPRNMMEYSGVPYPEDTPLFPTNTAVAKYLHDYARELEDRGIIKYNSRVINIRRCQHQARNIWQVTVQLVGRGGGMEELKYYDDVIVVLGTFTKPHVPDKFELRPGSRRDMNIMHSKYYRNAEDSRGEKVLIVGGGPSYWDMSSAIAEMSGAQVFVSVRNEPFVLSSLNQQKVPEVRSVSTRGKKVYFVGGKELEVDIILLCTGYLYDFSMIPCVETSTEKKRVLSLYEHMIYINEKEDPTRQSPESSVFGRGQARQAGHSTLAFVGLPTMDSVFLVAEAQSAFIARYFSGRIKMSTPYMQMVRNQKALEFDEQVTRGRKEDGFHNLVYPRDAQYVDALFERCVQVEAPRDPGTGKTPVFHPLKLHWIRTPNGSEGGIGIIRRVYQITAKTFPSMHFPTVESLGFQFDINQASSAERQKEEFMRGFQTLMEEKRERWANDYWSWKRGSDEWQRKWDSLVRLGLGM
ncbi:Thiol-specific monooxygenase [Lachnellula subtilissima]|uniref:Thiol-specific monooxygenase n=1 Tax=Lachnellula subtilissima TaxID=602034 RepID=A0A8H8S0M2_9HELO|nr:Thiol-specific monooxygenase [Lachnellula subtilissima]